MWLGCEGHDDSRLSVRSASPGVGCEGGEGGEGEGEGGSDYIMRRRWVS
jgi:hypothetical protein